MRYNFNGKTLTIPDKEIKNNMELLRVTKEKAIEIWLEDNEFLENAEQQELQKKAETQGGLIAREASPKLKRKREQKEDKTKEDLISAFAYFLEDKAENVEILNKNKLISFSIGSEKFEIDLKRKKK